MSAAPLAPPPSEPAPAPPPTLIETIGLEYGRGGVAPDWGRNQVNYEGKLQDQIRQALRQRGYQVDDYILGDAREGRSMTAFAAQRGVPSPMLSVAAQRGYAAEQRMYQALATERQRDPRFLADLSDVRDPETLSAAARKRRAQETADYDRRLDGSPFLGRVIGDVAEGFTRPENYFPIGGEATASVGIGRRIIGGALRGARTNVAITAATEPGTVVDAHAMGIDYGVQQVASDLGGAALFGGLIEGGAPAVHASFSAGLKRIRGAGTEVDRTLVAGLDAAVPPAIRTPDEHAAAHVLTRVSDIAESSPMAPGAAGDAAHVGRLGAAYDALTGADVPRVTRPVPEGALARAELKRRIARVESGGDDHAANPLSTARGRYQFTLPTWLSYYKRRYGTGKLSNDEIWAKRYDNGLQEVLMDDLTADNGGRLRAAQLPETAANLYMVHFLGPDGIKVLHADPATPLDRLLPPRDFKANPFLRGKTSGELAAWADRKMGGRGEIRAAGGEAPAIGEEGGAVPEGAEPWPELTEEPRDFRAERELGEDDRPSLRSDLFGTPEEHAAAQLALWREEGFAPPATREATMASPDAGGPVLDMKSPERAPVRRSGPVDVMQAIADAGGLRDDEGHDLVKGRNIPRFIRGAGVIIHDGGKSIDAMAEHLWEQGWFGPPSTVERPREDAVLDLVERGVRGRVFKPEDIAVMAERAAARRSAPEDEVRFELASHAADNGIKLDRHTLDEAVMHRAGGDTVEGAVARAVHEAAYRDGEAPAGLDRFEDPEGEGVTAQTESLEHDLRMVAEGGDDGGYRLDEEGAVVSLAELFEQIDDDVRAADALSQCMAPMGVAAE